MSQPIRSQRRPSCFSDRPENTTVVEDVSKILLPVKCRCNPFSGFIGEVENVKVNDDGRRTTRDHKSALEPSAQVHKQAWLYKRHRNDVWDQVSLNNVQRFQRRSQKCICQSEARAANLFF